MPVIDRLMMFSMAVFDMDKSREFYADMLGLQVVSDVRQDDGNRWVSLVLPVGGVTVTLTTRAANMSPGTAQLYFGTPDVAAANEELRKKFVRVNEIKDDLFGPGSGVKWFDVEDPDGNQIYIVQTQAVAEPS